METRLAACTFVECYEWLGVYVQADICPAAAKTKLMQSFFGRFGGMEAFREILAGLDIWPPHVLEAALSFRSEDRPKLDNARELRMPIELCASMAADFAFSTAEKAFVSIVFLSNAPYWETFLKEPPRADSLAWALSGGADPWLDGNRHLAYAGLVRTVEHTKGLSQFLQELQESTNHDDWVSFREGVKAAHGWRLDPPGHGAKDRYQAMTTIVSDLITEGLKRGEIKTEESFDADAKASVGLWRSITGPKWAVGAV